MANVQEAALASMAVVAALVTGPKLSLQVDGIEFHCFTAHPVPQRPAPTGQHERGLLPRRHCPLVHISETGDNTTRHTYASAYRTWRRRLGGAVPVYERLTHDTDARDLLLVKTARQPPAAY